MFYVSKQVSERKYGVVDTTDNVEEVHDAMELLQFVNKGIAILGVILTPQGTAIRVCSPVVRLLCHIPYASPVRIKYAGDMYKTVLYLGMVGNTFKFYDGGLAPFCFSQDFIDSAKVDVKTDDIDADEFLAILNKAKRR